MSRCGGNNCSTSNIGGQLLLLMTACVRHQFDNKGMKSTMRSKYRQFSFRVLSLSLSLSSSSSSSSLPCSINVITLLVMLTCAFQDVKIDCNLKNLDTDHFHCENIKASFKKRLVEFEIFQSKSIVISSLCMMII